MLKKLAILLLMVLVLAGCTPLQTIPQTTAPTEPPIPENPYGPLDFAYEGEYLTCLAGESLTGIDVSEWQGQIDWEQVAASGVEFVMIRAAWRGTDPGGLNPDAMAQSYYEGAKAAGLKVGAYIFSQAISAEEAEEEARYLLEQVQDWELDYPLVFDWEYVNAEARTANVDARTLTDCCLRFCQVILQAGQTPMVYFNPAQEWERLYLEELVEYPFWLAMYDSTMVYPHKIQMWQYTDSGTVPGISTPVDLNVWLVYPEEIPEETTE